MSIKAYLLAGLGAVVSVFAFLFKRRGEKIDELKEHNDIILDNQRKLKQIVEAEQKINAQYKAKDEIINDDIRVVDAFKFLRSKASGSNSKDKG